jgi:Flp pilus assembly protein TadD
MHAYKERQFAEAAGNFQLAVHRNPNDAKAQHYLALASARSGDMRTAVKALESAIALDGHNVALLKDAGTIFRQAGLLVKAERPIRRRCAGIRRPPKCAAPWTKFAPNGPSSPDHAFDRSLRSNRRRPQAKAQ